MTNQTPPGEERWQALSRDIRESLAEIAAIDERDSPSDRSIFVNSIAQRAERLAAAGEVELMGQVLGLVRSYNDLHDRPAIPPGHRFWNLGEVAIQTATAQSHPDVIRNHHLNKAQIVFASEPTVELVGVLRKEGWKWSKDQGAWQRKLTGAALESAKRITGLG
jgi:hypothetical protein